MRFTRDPCPRDRNGVEAEAASDGKPFPDLAEIVASETGLDRSLAPQLRQDLLDPVS
jgi:hypothetical protein